MCWSLHLKLYNIMTLCSNEPYLKNFKKERFVSSKAKAFLFKNVQKLMCFCIFMLFVTNYDSWGEMTVAAEPDVSGIFDKSTCDLKIHFGLCFLFHWTKMNLNIWYRLNKSFPQAKITLSLKIHTWCNAEANYVCLTHTHMHIYKC